MNDVRRLLVTGSDRDLARFDFLACFVLKVLASQGQTVFYACPAAHFEWALEVAREAGVEVKEFLMVDGMAAYEIHLEARPA